MFTDLCWKLAEKAFKNFNFNENILIFLDNIYSQLRCTILLADLAETADPATATLVTVQLSQLAESSAT